IFLRLRFLARPLTRLPLDFQEGFQPLRPPVLGHLSQIILDPRPFAGLPSHLEAVGCCIEPSLLFVLHLAHSDPRRLQRSCPDGLSRPAASSEPRRWIAASPIPGICGLYL